MYNDIERSHSVAVSNVHKMGVCSEVSFTLVNVVNCLVIFIVLYFIFLYSPCVLYTWWLYDHDHCNHDDHHAGLCREDLLC